MGSVWAYCLSGTKRDLEPGSEVALPLSSKSVNVETDKEKKTKHKVTEKVTYR